jgi:hydrogenase maturation protease
MPGARVIGLGQAAGGDDGVGLAVLDELRERSLSADIELRAAAGPGALIDLLDGKARTILVDAVLGENPGEVIEIGPRDLDSRSASRLSSHGLGAAQAIDLARVLHGGAEAAAIRIVAVTIARPEHARYGLSPEVAAAVPRAADRVLDLLGVAHA